MKCERCGMENYDETYYCKGCGLEFGALEMKREFVEEHSEGYDNNLRLPSQTDSTSGSFVDNNIYTKNLYHTDEAVQQEETETHDNYNDNSESDTAKLSLKKNSQSDNVPEYIYNREYDFYSMSDISNRKKRLIVWDRKNKLITLAVVCAVGLFGWLAITFGKFDTEELVYAEPTIEATLPTEPPTYIAELSYSKHTITDFSGEKINVQFPIPRGYEYEFSPYESYASFAGTVDGGQIAILSTVVFKGDIQKEIDYFKGVYEESQNPLVIEKTDTALGEMTVITMSNSSNATVYQVYVKLDKKNYFHISLSNIPESYKKEARKLIDLIVQDTVVDFIKE